MNRDNGRKSVLRFFALFMIVVLSVTAMPQNVYGQGTLYLQVRIQNGPLEEYADTVMEHFYVYNLVSGEKYYFTEKKFDRIWYVTAYYPEAIAVGIKNDRGEVVYTGHDVGSVGYYTRITTTNVRNEEGIVDTIYTMGSGIKSESTINKPVRDGYEIVGWVDEIGEEVIFPLDREFFFDVDVRTIYPVWALDTHEFTGREEIIDYPSCTEEGLKRIYCKETGCTRYIEEPMEVIDHEYSTDWYFDATYHYHLCTSCGIHEQDIAHTMGQWIEVEPTSFNEDGSEERTCLSCDYSEERRIPKLSESHVHDYSGTEVVVKESNCVEEGVKKVYCSEPECGEYIEEPIEKSGHKYGTEWEYDEVNHYHTCSVCKYHQEDLLHKMGAWVEVTPAKFREDGLEERQCTVCDYVQQRNIPKLIDSHVHDYTGVEEVVDKPTCTEKGLKKVYCSEVECSAYIEENIDKEAHDYDTQWEYNDEVHYHTCKVCKAHDRDILHEMGEWVEVTGATFDEDGLEERKCTRCDYKEERRIPKRSESHVHDYTGEENVIDEPSCTKEGLKKVFCSEPECGEYIEEPIDKLEHEYKIEWEYDDEKHYHSCQKCGIHDEDILHTMGQWEEVVPAKFREDGKAVRKCETCQYSEEKVLQKLVDSHVHDYTGTEEIVKSATCVENGLKKVYCVEEECGAYLEVAIVDGEHQFGAEWEYDGEAHYRICDLCGERSDEHKHKLGEGVVVKVAAEDEDGIMEWSCEECAYVLQEPIKYVKPEVPNEDEEVSKPAPEVTPKPAPESTPEVVPDTPVIKDEPVKEEAPYTGDIAPVKMYATLAMIAGFTYVLAMFVGDKLGMSEEKKEDIVGKLVAFGKGRNRFIKAIAIAAIFVVLAYYHAIGKNCCKAEELIKEM